MREKKGFLFLEFMVVVCLMTIAGVGLALGATGTGKSIPSAAGLSYDDLEAQGLQLLQNGSFERMDRSGVRLLDWGVYRAVQDRLHIITDSKTSKHGAIYITFQPDKLRYLYGRLKGTPSGKLRMSVWAKGEGRMYFRISLGRRSWRGKKLNSPANLSSGWFSVKSKDWVNYAYDFDVPESVEVEGKPERPESIGVQIAVKGKISLDQGSVVAVKELEKATQKAKQSKGESADLRPFLVIPKFSKPPRIDGEIGVNEWSRAAAVTGFTQVNTRKLALRQTVVYVGYDDKNLYFAFRSPQEGRFGEGKFARDRGWNSQTEAIEIWLQPPGGQWYQFLGWPAGGILDQSKKEGLKWNANWEFQNKVKDSGETVGGVLTFAKKIWTAEVSIPFKDLGVTAPRNGETWRMNFCRDFSVKPGKARRARDWTTWSPIQGGFNSPGQFASVVFQSRAPAVQFLKLGDLTNGDLTVSGLYGAKKGKMRIEARAATAEGNKTISFQSKEIEPRAGSLSKFALSDTLKVAGATDINFQLTAEEVETGRILAYSVIPFTARAALRLKLIPVLSQNILYANVDAGRLPELPARFKVEVEIFRNDLSTGISTSAIWRRENPKGDLKLDISALAPGDYQVKAFIKDRQSKKVLASSVAFFPVVKKPTWLGNKLGISDKVPAPWEPVKVDSRQVVITQREYCLENIGLPAQVTALGKNIFAGPPGLKVVLGGKEVRWETQPLKLLSRKDGQVVWEIKGRAGSLTLKGKLTIEFDGFAFWEVTIRSRKATTVDSLILEFPFKKESSLYARGRDATRDDGVYDACLYNTKKPSPSDITGIHFSSRGWVWPEAWVDEIWVGDDFRGFSVMNETQEYLKGKKRTEIEKSKKANILKIYLIDGPYKLEEPLKYRYAWQATPVKPRPDNPKIWHATYGGIPEKGFLKRVYVATPTYWALKYISYPALFLPKRIIDKKNAIYREAGVKVVPYFAVQAITTEAPELKPFLKEWERYPGGSIGGPRGGSEIASVADKSFADFIVYATRKIVDELGLDGFYLDVSSAGADSNHYHGSGWWDKENKKWQPTVDIFATREVYKRLYNVLKSKGRDGVLFRHGMPVAAVAGFVDVVTQGEEWCREGTKQYDRLTPDIFRTKEMRIQYGTPYTWYVFHHYGRGLKYGGRVPLTAILAYSLPHHVLPTDGESGMWPVWDVMDEFWTSAEFIPYWNPNTPIRIKEENVLGSLYLKRAEKKALLVVANWNKEPRTVEVRIDLRKLGLGKRLKLTRALKHPIRDPKDPPGSDPMKNIPLVYRNGYLHLELAGRNLEVILIEGR